MSRRFRLRFAILSSFGAEWSISDEKSLRLSLRQHHQKSGGSFSKRFVRILER